jgi:hypothetical protein
MNEKIKELAKQATNQYSPTYYTPEWIEKFARLIILECSELCYTSHLKDSDAHAMNILDHFNIDGAKHWK